MIKIDTAAIAIAFASAFALAAPATAQDAARPSGTIVAGAGLFPEYEGADRLMVFPLVNGRISLGQRYVAIDGLTLRANILAHESLEAGPLASLTFGRDAKVRSRAVALLSPRKDAVEAGGFVGWRIDPGNGDVVRFAVQAARDVSGVHRGWVGAASTSYTAFLGKRWVISAEAAASVADGAYTRTYFSISPGDAGASGLRAFAAKGGLRDVGLLLGARYALSQRWSLNGFAGYQRLVGDAAKSPIVRDEGDRNQLSFGAGVGFSF